MRQLDSRGSPQPWGYVHQRYSRPNRLDFFIFIKYSNKVTKMQFLYCSLSTYISYSGHYQNANTRDARASSFLGNR